MLIKMNLHRFPNLFSKLLFLGTVSLLLPMVEAQENWFRVELIAFAPTNIEAVNAEQWQGSPELSYTTPVTLIRSSAQATMTDALFAIALRRSAINDSLSEGQAAVLPTPSNPTGLALGNLNTLDEDWIMPKWRIQKRVMAGLPINQAFFLPGMKKPYVLLQQQQLKGISKKMAQSSRFRIIFHWAWEQALPANEPPTNLLIRGGQRYGRHFELEGSMSLYRKRYLHVMTNLWFNRFIPKPVEVDDSLPPEPENYGYRLPRHPDRTASLSLILSGNQVKEIVLTSLETPTETPDLAAEEGNESDHDTSEEILNQAPWLKLGANSPATSHNSAINDEKLSEFFTNLSQSSDANLGQAAPPDYGQWKLQQVFPMKQVRRLRSNELHYFDHPAFGLLLQLYPL